MPFETIIGQTRAKETLSRSLERNRIPHALLFHGPEGVGKEAMAMELAKSLICTVLTPFACGECSDCRRISQLSHPDVSYIFPEMSKVSIDDRKEIVKSIVLNPYLRLNLWANPSISIEQIRNLRRASALSSFENKGRAVIIAEAHHMTTEAANALLKILEEPPDKMTIILTSSQHTLLLPTIISRCQLIKFDPISWQNIQRAMEERMQIPSDRAQLIAKLSIGSYRRALELLGENLEQRRNQIIDMLRIIIRDDLDRLSLMEQLVKNEDKKSIKELLEILLLWFRDVLIYQEANRNNELIVNVDQMPTLEKFCSSLESMDVGIIVSEIEKAIERIDRNVYINLILINLFYRLRRHMRRKIHA